MFCRNCGNQIPDGSSVCNYCGQRLSNSPKGINGNQRQMAYSAPRKRIDNIFSALMYERTTGVIMEFSLWCAVCTVVFLSLIAAILGKGNVAWIMMMFFSVGLGVIMAFRLKPIAMLYSVSVFHLMLFIIHYISFSKSYAFYDVSYSVLNIILFVSLLLLSVAIVTCGCIQFFSRINLGNVLTIMVIVDSALILILNILMYAVSHFGDDAEYANEWTREYLNYRGYWVGTISFWLILGVVTLLFAFFFWGCIDSKKDKIVNLSSARSQYGTIPGIKGVSGMYTGQVIHMQGGTVTIGSGAGMTLTIQDSCVSGRHCAIRFNSTNGFYEIYDDSTNGVYLSTGVRLQKGVYNSVQRGSIIYIGSTAQQFQLM